MFVKGKAGKGGCVSSDLKRAGPNYMAYCKKGRYEKRQGTVSQTERPKEGRGEEEKSHLSGPLSRRRLVPRSISLVRVCSEGKSRKTTQRGSATSQDDVRRGEGRENARAISGERGSSALGSVSIEQIESKTVLA